MAKNMIQETVWFDQPRVENSEKLYQEVVAQRHSGLEVVGVSLETTAASTSTDPLASLQQARGLIDTVLNQPILVSRTTEELERRVSVLETENKELKSRVANLEERLAALEGGTSKQGGVGCVSQGTKAAVEDDDDDDANFDPFASDNDDEETVKKPVEQKPAASKKPKKVVIAKSSLVLDVKPWDDETDIAEMEKCVRSVSCDGLLWGASKILPVAYGIKKLQISCVIEDDKVGTDFLEEAIGAFEDLVQSVDVVAFNKI